MTGSVDFQARLEEKREARRRADVDDVFVAGKNGPKFVPKKLADKLAAETPVAVGGETMFVFRDGVYRPGGEEDLRLRIASALGDFWKRAHADEVIAYLRDSSQRLWSSPPLDKINCRNGLLDVDTRRLEPHDPQFLSPVQIGAAFDASARAVAIEKFASDVFPADSLGVFWEITGYLIIPDNSLQTAFMFLGGGANGKSKTLALYTVFLGPANVSTVALHKLEEDRFATADLYGKLANIFPDLDARALRASSIFKAVTGGDAVRGERKFRPAFDFVPYARLLFSANEPPPTSDPSDAFFRRWETVPFERTFRPGDPGFDARILDKLTTPAELSGLLNLALDALPGLMARGRFTRTPTTQGAATKFRVETDSVAGFLDECCDLVEDRRVRKPELAFAYRNWCQQNGRMAVSTQRFNRRVKTLVPEAVEVTVGGVQQWKGITLLPLGAVR